MQYDSPLDAILKRILRVEEFTDTAQDMQDLRWVRHEIAAVKLRRHWQGSNPYEIEKEIRLEAKMNFVKHLIAQEISKKNWPDFIKELLARMGMQQPYSKANRSVVANESGNVASEIDHGQRGSADGQQD